MYNSIDINIHQYIVDLSDEDLETEMIRRGYTLTEPPKDFKPQKPKRDYINVDINIDEYMYQILGDADTKDLVEEIVDRGEEEAIIPELTYNQCKSFYKVLYKILADDAVVIYNDFGTGVYVLNDNISSFHLKNTLCDFLCCAKSSDTEKILQLLNERLK